MGRMGYSRPGRNGSEVWLPQLPVNIWVSSEALSVDDLFNCDFRWRTIRYTCYCVPGFEKTLGLRGDLDLRHVFLVL